MTDEITCPHCGKPVPPSAPGGICPECMLKAGLTAQTEGPDETGPHGTKVVHPPPSPAEIAALFPQLEILECLGRGGMGVVYKARQPRLNRFVALKILAREKEQDPHFTERFTREAQALARLNHPNIVTVHDFGEAAGHCYLVMEFVDGLNLRQLLQIKKMAPEQALTIVPKICEALQYAHEQGIVHRDIKPENILLDKSGRVKIADFGIAKMLGEEAGQQTLTGAKDAVGTPHYMAPEQIEKPLSVDHRADIYSLGVVFYEMLTGELPLGKFQPPSKKVHIDVRLDEVVLHALEKEPERRYQQASQIKTAVETISTTAPAKSTITAGQIETVRSELKIPARGLMGAGVLLLLFSAGLLIFALPAIAHEGGDPAGYAAVIFGATVFVIFAAIVLSGASKMMKLRNYPFSVAASIVAAFAGPGALLGMPFGVWAVVILNRRETREAFESCKVPGTTGQGGAGPFGKGRSPLRIGILAGISVFILTMAAASIITFLLPKVYVGDAQVKIISPPPLQYYNPDLAVNEIVFIRSRVLPKVADSLNLPERWGKRYMGGRALTDNETYNLMERDLDIEPVKNTILVDVRFYSPSSTEAAEIANKIAEVYCTYPPGRRGDIVRLAEPASHPSRPNVPLNIFLGVVAGGVIGTCVGLIAGLFSFWRMRSVRHQPPLPDIQPAAESWLAQVDNADYARSWETAAPYFQRAITRDEWVGRLQKARYPLGRVISRKFTSSRPSVAGTRLTVKFATAFDGLSAATETVTFAKQADGEWRAIGYLVRPAGFSERIAGGPASGLPCTPLSKAFGWIWGVVFAGYFFLLLNDHFGIPNDAAWRYFNWFFLSFAAVSGVELFFRMRQARRTKTLEGANAVSMLWKPLLVAALISFALVVYFALLRHAHQMRSTKSDYIGQAWFPRGDSIEITSVERSSNRVVVKGHYELVSADKAGLTLHISQTNGPAIPADVTPGMFISRGRGEFELVDPNPFPGFLHVDISSDIGGWPIASLYFGTRSEALAESKASWITNAPPISSASNPSQLAQEGWQLWQAQKFAEAAAKFRQAVQLAPGDANAWNGLGWARFNSGNSREAEREFRKAILLDPNQPGALNGLGQIYLSERKYDQAEKYLLKAAPQAPAAWYGLTRLYLLQGKYDQAGKWAQDLIDSGQADDLVRQMLKAAQAKHLSEGLRFRIEPPMASIPGIPSTPHSKAGSTLQFRLVLPQDSREPADSLHASSGRNPLRVSREVLLDDTAIAQAGVDFSPDGRREIQIRFTGAGAKRFEAITATNVGHQLAIVFHGTVLSAPVIQAAIPGGECQVTGFMSADEINEIVDCLNHVTTPSAKAWVFSPVHERILPLQPSPHELFGWLDLDSGTVLTNSTLDWQTRPGHDWIQAHGLDVVTTESAKPLPLLLGLDMIIDPAPTNGWDIVTPADVIYDWPLLQEEPRQMHVFGDFPGQTDTFFFQTREGGNGVLQISGFADNPHGVKIRYKLVQPAVHQTAVDPVTGLPMTPGGAMQFDPTTGLPVGSTNARTIDPATGLPM